MYAADLPEARRHTLLANTLEQLSAAELRALARARWGEAGGRLTRDEVARRFFNTEGLAGSGAALPPRLLWMLHHMAFNEAALDLGSVGHFFYERPSERRLTLKGELRSLFKALKAAWLPTGWLLVACPAPIAQLDPRNEVLLHLPAAFRAHLPAPPLAARPFPATKPGGVPFWSQVLKTQGQALGRSLFDARQAGLAALTPWFVTSREAEFTRLASEEPAFLSPAANLLYALSLAPPGSGLEEQEALAAFASLTQFYFAEPAKLLREGEQLGVIERHGTLVRLAPEAAWLIAPARHPREPLVKVPRPRADGLTVKPGELPGAALVDLACVSDLSPEGAGWRLQPSPAKLGRRRQRDLPLLEQLPGGLARLTPWQEAAQAVVRDFGAVIAHGPLHVLAIADPAVAVALMRELGADVAPLAGPGGGYLAFHPSKEAAVLRAIGKQQLAVKEATRP